MNAASQMRLPGVYFLPPPRVAGPGLPPLDVAAFVGFAERGPLDLPVPVEDLNAYRAVFGGDLPLARERGGLTVYANLPTSVAAFFANGGRRAYVVRVAGRQAKATRFRAPGLIALDGAANAKLAAIRASSAGRWSDRMRLGARLRITPLPVAAFEVAGERQLQWQTGGAPQAIQTGDLLRLEFEDGRQWLFPVASLERALEASPFAGASLAPPAPAKAILTAQGAWQLVSKTTGSPPLDVSELRRLTLDGTEALSLSDDNVLSTEQQRLKLRLIGEQAEKARRGDVLRLRLSDGATYLFPVTALRLVSESSSAPPPMRQADALAVAMLRLPAQPLPEVSPPPRLRRVERLRFDLLLREAEERRLTLEEMAFNRAHPRFWGEAVLLESSVIERRPSSNASGRRAAEAARLFRELQQETRREQSQTEPLDLAALAGLLAPLADTEAALTFLPLGMPAIVTEYDLSEPAAGEIGSDDLDAFDTQLFLDRYLAPNPQAQGSSSSSLLADAFDRYYAQNKRLRGLHSLMFVDEVALISVPDGAHRDWEFTTAEAPSQPTEPIAPPPDWSIFLDCEQAPTAPPEPPLTKTPTPPRLPTLQPAEEFESGPMLSLQRAVTNFCQARRDLVGVLALPLHFEKRQCIEWQEEFRRRLGLPPRRSSRGFFEEARDIADLSYVAVYHPWLFVADANAPGRMRAAPPDGAVCGMIAARELARQVWVAPANVPLQGALGLTPSFSTEDWAELFERQFNLARPEPHDFRVMSAHTLSDDRALLQLSVRRLMILLRKTAVTRGMDFVFESNHNRFREGVRVSLEAMLRFMFERGAFAGVTTRQAFRVTTDASVNPPQSIEQGRFIAQIQVAPSQPMEFITVLLTRIGDELLQAIEA
jgi:hypothetical protein